MGPIDIVTPRRTNYTFYYINIPCVCYNELPVRQCKLFIVIILTAFRILKKRFCIKYAVTWSSNVRKDSKHVGTCRMTYGFVYILTALAIVSIVLGQLYQSLGRIW